jgi:hypothetical protein
MSKNKMTQLQVLTRGPTRTRVRKFSRKVSTGCGTCKSVDMNNPYCLRPVLEQLTTKPSGSVASSVMKQHRCVSDAKVLAGNAMDISNLTSDFFVS